MTKSVVRSIVIAELEHVQKAIGGPIVSITTDTRPIGDLARFDSPVAEDTTATILGRLDADPDIKCPFTLREEGEHLTVEKIVDYFCKAMGITEE